MLTRSLLRVTRISHFATLASSTPTTASALASTCPARFGLAATNSVIVYPRSIMSSSTTSSKHTSITHVCLSDLYKYWFEHAPTSRDGQESKDTPGALADIPKESLQIWFQGSEEVDNHCRSNFKGAVETAISTPVQDLIELGGKDDTGKDALALILLLDQMPRNIYRGKEAKIAYKQCDPKAQELAKTFTRDPFNFDDPKKCPTWWHQSFMYMPFMHAEAPELHELMLKKLDKAIEQSKSEGEIKAIQATKKFEEKHYETLKMFGRYPSRNDALGRKNTPEEEEFLKNGPGW